MRRATRITAGVAWLVTLVPAGAGAAGFSRPQTLGPAPIWNEIQTPAINAHGEAVVAWLQPSVKPGQARTARILVARAPASGRFGTAASFPVPAGVSGVSAVIDGDGTTVVTWTGPNDTRASVEYMAARRRGGFGPTRHFAPPADATNLVLTYAGRRFLAAWTTPANAADVNDHNRTVWAAYGSPSGHFDAPRQVVARTGSAGILASATHPYRLLVFFSRARSAADAPQGLSETSVLLLAPGTTRVAPVQQLDETLLRPGFNTDAGLVTVGTAGLAVTSSQPTSDGACQLAVQHATGGAPFAPATLVPAYPYPDHWLPASHGADAVECQGGAAFPARGTAVVAGTETSVHDGDTTSILRSIAMASAQRPDGSFGPPGRLSTPGMLADHIAVTELGDAALLLWNERAPRDPKSYGFTDGYNYATYRYVRHATTGFSAPLTLGTRATRHDCNRLSTSDKPGCGVAAPRIATAGHRAVAAWIEPGRVRAAVLDD